MAYSDIPVINVPDVGLFRADYLDELKQKKAAHLEATKEARRRDSFSNIEMTAELEQGLAKYGRIGGRRMDSTQTNMVARALVYQLAQIKMITHPGDILEQAFIVNQEGGPGIGSMNYTELDYNGEFRPLAGSATDLHEIGSTLTETPKKVVTYAAAMGWSLQDMERAGFGGVNLLDRKNRAVAMAASKKKNVIAWTGDPDGLGITGLFNYTLNPVTIGGSWGTDANVILTDMLEIVNEPGKDTEDYETEIVTMDTTSFTYMNKPRSNTDTSIGAYLLNNTSCRAILKTSYLNSVTSSVNSLSADRVIVAMPRNADIAEFRLPRDLQFFPVQQRGLNFLVPVVMDVAGLFVYKSGTGGPIAFAVPS